MSEGRGLLLLALVVVFAAWAAVAPMQPLPIATEQQRPEPGISAQGEPTNADQIPSNSLPSEVPAIKAQTKNGGTGEDATGQDGEGIDFAAWIEAFGVVITAVFTGILSAATIRLWNSTKGLYEETRRLAEGAEAQSVDMKASIAAATRSATASEKAVVHAETSSQRQLRAYVGVEKLDFDIDTGLLVAAKYVPKSSTVVGTPPDGFIRVRVKNFGNSPASDVMVFVHWQLTEKHTRLPIGFFATRDTDKLEGGIRNTVSKSLLHSGQTHDSYVNVFDLRPMRAAYNREGELFIFGRIYYRDAFDRNWRTKFCFEWQPEDPSAHRQYIPYEEYNGEDQKRLEDQT